MPLWLLALLTFSGTLAMHIFVPALPSAAIGLGAGTGAMQMTVSLYILGLAFGQLIYGPLSDRFGRRPTMMFGLALYTAAGLAAAVAPGVRFLIVARLFQALGGCAGLVLGRAIVRDTSAPADAARRLALLNLVMMVGPGLAPLVGSALAATAGWRSVLAVLCVLGIVNLILSWRMLPETGKVAPLGAASLARNYGRLLGSRAFIGFSVGGGCATTSLYAFVAAAPFVFVDQLHRPAYEVGPALAFMISGVAVGSLIARRLIPLVSMKRLLVASNAVSVLAAFVLLGAVLTGHLSVVLMLGAMFVLTVGVGVASPAALTEAISVNPAVIGSAAGLYGFTQMSVGAICTGLVGVGHNPALTAAAVLAVAGVVAQVSFWIAMRPSRAGRVRDRGKRG